MAEQVKHRNESEQPFKRLQTELAEMIANTPDGERLPSEPDLASQLKASRATLREAMRTFESQGLIRRRQGIGTFVVGQHQLIETGLEVLESIETIARRKNLTVSMGDLEIVEAPADLKEAGSLGLDAGAPIIRVTRVIYSQSRPIAYLTDILPDGVLTRSDFREDFTGSVIDILLRQETPSPYKSFTEIQAVAASSEIAKALQIQRGDVLLKFIARLFATNGQILDHSYSYFLPGGFSFHVVRSVGSERPVMVVPEAGSGSKNNE